MDMIAGVSGCTNGESTFQTLAARLRRGPVVRFEWRYSKENRSREITLCWMNEEFYSRDWRRSAEMVIAVRRLNMIALEVYKEIDIERIHRFFCGHRSSAPQIDEPMSRDEAAAFLVLLNEVRVRALSDDPLPSAPSSSDAFTLTLPE